MANKLETSLLFCIPFKIIFEGLDLDAEYNPSRPTKAIPDFSGL